MYENTQINTFTMWMVFPDHKYLKLNSSHMIYYMYNDILWHKNSRYMYLVYMRYMEMIQYLELFSQPSLPRRD